MNIPVPSSKRLKRGVDMVTIFLLKMLVREVCPTKGSNDTVGGRLRSRMIDLTAMIMDAT
jgi:hypothetical protein